MKPWAKQIQVTPVTFGVTNEWVKILNVSDWFAWVGFEDAPESYFADV